MPDTTNVPLFLQVKDVMYLLGYTSYTHSAGIVKEVKEQLNIKRKIRGITVKEFCTVFQVDEQAVVQKLISRL